MAAVACRLHAVIENPHLGSPHLQRHVEWELDNVILVPLRLIRVLRYHCARSNALVVIESLVADALGSMVMQHSRSLHG